jgi:hypothetical protein
MYVMIMIHVCIITLTLSCMCETLNASYIHSATVWRESQTIANVEAEIILAKSTL